MIGDTLAHLATCEIHGIVFAAGYLSGAVYCERSDDNGQTNTPFADTTDQSLVGSSDNEQPAIEAVATGELLVSMTDAGSVVTYLSQDFGNSWTQVDAL